MILSIQIRKIFEDYPYYYYKINSKFFECNQFYIKINSKEKTVSIYKADDFEDSNILGIFNFNNPSAFKNIPDIPVRMLGSVLYKVEQAIQQNNFPLAIDYVA